MKKLNIDHLSPIFGGASNTAWHLLAGLAGVAYMHYYPLPSVYIDPNTSRKNISLYFYHHSPKKVRR